MLKNLFKKSPINKTKQELDNKIGSDDSLEAHITSRNKRKYGADFSDFSRFCRYGKADLYVKNSFSTILNDFPYDGSFSDIESFFNRKHPYVKYFYEQWPSRDGHIWMNQNPGTPADTEIFGGETYKLFSSPQYVKIFGMSRLGADNTRKGANIYNSDTNLTGNFTLDPDNGNTIEFWMFGEVADPTCILDVWNQIADSDAAYGRLLIESLPNSSGQFDITYRGGSDGFTREAIGDSASYESYDSDGWNHYAIVLSSSGEDLSLNLYVNGNLEQTITGANEKFDSIDGNLIAHLGSYQYRPDPSVISVTSGWGASQNRFDDFRFWKTSRTSLEIKRFWNKKIFGGANKNSAHHSLGCYFRFNEAIYSNSEDANIVDYSGRICNGELQNYQGGEKIDGSAITNSVVTESVEPKDIILHPEDVNVIDFYDNLLNLAVSHDTLNNQSFDSNFPTWILEEDNEGELYRLLHSVGAYLDILHLQAENISRIDAVEYNSEISSANSIAREQIDSAGFDISSIFDGSDELEELLNQHAEGYYEYNIEDVRNTIYQNIFNSAYLLNKSKGSLGGLKNALRVLGISDNLVKYVTYAQDSINDYQDRNLISCKKNFVNFFSENNVDASIYQDVIASDVLSEGVIVEDPSTPSDKLDNTSFTAQCIVNFPEYFDSTSDLFLDKEISTLSVFGNVEPDTGTSRTIANIGNFDVLVERDIKDRSKRRARFKLVSSGSGTSGFGSNIILTSDYYENIFSDTTWVLTVKLYPNSETIDYQDSISNDNYTLELSGHTKDLGEEYTSFSLSYNTISNARANSFLTSKKRLYVGAKYEDWSNPPSREYRTECKISSLRVWLCKLNEEDEKTHIDNIFLHGVRDQHEHPYFYNSDFRDSYIRKNETLILNWNFDLLFNSDSSGEAEVIDSSAFYDEDVAHYGVFDNYTLAHYNGKGVFFPSSVKIVEERMSLVEVILEPGQISYSDTISIESEQQAKISFSKERINSTLSNVEISPHSSLSRDILNFFSKPKEYSNLFARPVDRYRPNYKRLDSFARVYFEGYSDKPDFDKFVDYFKWIDSSILNFLQRQLPDKLETVGVSIVYESHVLERNKYWNKFPTIETPKRELDGSVKSIVELKYDWRHGHAPVGSSDETENCLWWSHRSSSDTGDADIDFARDTIRDSIFSIGRDPTRPFDLAGSSFYSGSKYLSNKLVHLTDISSDGVHASRSLTLPKILGDINSGITYDVYLDGETTRCQDGFDLFNDHEVSSDVLLSNNEKYDSTEFSPLTQRYEHSTSVLNKINNLTNFDKSYIASPWVRRLDPVLFDRAVNPNERPELYNITDNTTYFTYSSVALTEPRIWFKKSREKIYSVKNVKNVNYDFDYQVIQTSGKINNNKWWVETGSATGMLFTASSISSWTEYAVPDRSGGDHVFVNRFSSPGDFYSLGQEYLDYVAGEYSAFATVNYRNLIPRQDLQLWLTSHETKATASSDPFNYLTTVPGLASTVPSYHKVNKNSRLEQSYVSGVVEFVEKHDNWYINNNIPSNLYGYSWINDYSISKPSAGDTPTSIIRYSSDFDNINTDFEVHSGSLDGLIGTSSLRLQFFYDSGYVDQKSLKSNSDLSPIDHSHAPFSSWKQVRGHQDTFFRLYSDQNLINFEEKTDFYQQISNSKGITSFNDLDYHFEYRESPVAYHKPSRILLNYGTSGEVYVEHISSENDKNRLGNPKIRRILQGDYEYLDDSEVDRLLPSFGANSYFTIISYDILDSIYPLDRNLDAFYTRNRFAYNDSDNTNLHLRVGFWRDSIEDRLIEDDSQWFDSKATNYSTSSGGSLWPLDYVNTSSKEYYGNSNMPGVSYYVDKFVISTESAEKNLSTFYYLPQIPEERRGTGSSAHYNETPWEFYQPNAGEGPFYDSYEDFSEDVTNASKGMSIMPEFCVSEHMDYYISQNNFFVKNYGFLGLRGTENNSGSNLYSADTSRDNRYDDEFLKKYAVSEKPLNASRVVEQNSEDKRKFFYLKAEGYKKLLPYEGFYPALRMAQMAARLYEDYYPHVGGSAPIGSASDTVRAFQAFNQPLYCPGIAYNTIKSGIAVDWPTFRGKDDYRNGVFGEPEPAYLTPQGIVEPDEASYGYRLNNFGDNIVSGWEGFVLNQETPVSFSTASFLHFYTTDANGDIQYANTVSSGDVSNEFTNTPPSSNVFGRKIQRGKILISSGSSEYGMLFVDSNTAYVAGFSFDGGTITEVASAAIGANPLLGKTDDYRIDFAFFDSVPVVPPLLFNMTTTKEYAISELTSGPTSWSITGATGSSGGTGSDIQFFDTSVVSYGNEYLIFPRIETDTLNVIVDFYSIDTTLKNLTYYGKRTILGQNSFIIEGVLGLETLRTNARMWGNYYYELSKSEDRMSIKEIDMTSPVLDSGEVYADFLFIPLDYDRNFTFDSSQEHLTFYDFDISEKYLMLSALDSSAGKSYVFFIRRDKENLFLEFTKTLDGANGGLSDLFPAAIIGPDRITPKKDAAMVSQIKVNFLFESTRDVNEIYVEPEYTFFKDGYYSYHDRGYTPWFYTQRVDNFNAFSSSSVQRVLVSESNFRIPFEAIIKPSLGYPSSRPKAVNNEASSDNKIWWVGPEYYQGDSQNYCYPYFTWSGEAESPAYTLMANNFFGEVPNFFLKNQSFKSFVSLPEDKFKDVVSGTVYYMDVELYSYDLEALKSYGDAGQRDRDGQYFGPTMLDVPGENRYLDFTNNFLGISRYTKSESIEDPSHAPWVPPYYYGKETARLKFTATSSGRPTLGEILSNLEIEYINEEAEQKFIDKGDTSPPASPAYNSMMRMNSSVELKGKTKVKKVIYSSGNNVIGEYVPATVEDQQGSDSDAWAISPYFECPINNVANADLVDQGTGIWFSEPDYSDKSKGLYLSVNKTPDLGLGEESLLDIVGFSPSVEKLGEVAEEKLISEGIMVVPFVEKEIQGTTHEIQGFNVFTYDRDKFRVIKNNIKSEGIAVKQGQFGSAESIDKTSISEFIQASEKYYIPPFMNFVEQDNITPFASYIIEVEHLLSEDELYDIWNNRMPESSRKMSFFSEEIKHRMTKFDWFGGRMPPEDIRFLVFKVKKKSEKNYFAKTISSKDDNRFTFSQFENEIQYSYNWPYDFFSLIEKGRVFAGYELFQQELADQADLSEDIENAIKDDRVRDFNSDKAASAAAGELILYTDKSKKFI